MCVCESIIATVDAVTLQHVVVLMLCYYKYSAAAVEIQEL